MHEEYSPRHAVETSTERSFGLTVGGILAGIVVYRWWILGQIDTTGTVLSAITATLLFFGVIYPPALKPLNKAWTALGHLMFRIANPVIMLIIFVVTIIPIGLLLKITGKDPLRIKVDKSRGTYWLPREPVGPSPDSMKNQF